MVTAARRAGRPPGSRGVRVSEHLSLLDRRIHHYPVGMTDDTSPAPEFRPDTLAVRGGIGILAERKHAIEELYKEKGFRFAEVTFVLEDLGPGQKRATNASFTATTGSRPGPSASLGERPVTTGIRVVSK